MVEIERLPDGQWRVSRVLPCAASMQAAAMALEGVVPEAFAPVPVSEPPAVGHLG